jgi:hypothetical protein
VPVRGELVPGPGSFEIEVLDADPRRVKKVKVYRSKQPRTVREARREGEEAARPARPTSDGTEPAGSPGGTPRTTPQP